MAPGIIGEIKQVFEQRMLSHPYPQIQEPRMPCCLSFQDMQSSFASVILTAIPIKTRNLESLCPLSLNQPS